MSNTYTTAPNLPDTGGLISGSEIQATAWGNAADTLNRSAARTGHMNLVSQVFYSASTLETAYHDSASQSAIVGRWRIPYASDKHTALKVTFRAARLGAAASGSVAFFLFSSSVSMSVSTSFSTTALGTYTATFNIVGGTTDTDAELYFRLTNSYITTVCAYWDRILSPLPASAINIQGSDYVPHGLSAQSSSQPLPARLPLQMRDNVAALRAMPRVLMNWSHVGTTTVGAGTNDKAPDYAGAGFTDLYATHDYIFDGTQQGNYQAKVWILASNTTSTSSGVGSVRVFGQVLTFGDGWSAHNVTLNVISFSRGLTQAHTLPTAKIFIDREQGADRTEGLQDREAADKVPAPTSTGAQIQSISIWLI